MKPRYDVALLSVVSPWLSVYCSYLRKLLYCPAWLQLDLRCMLWWEVREIISENILLIISYHQPWRLSSPPPASSKSSSASLCSPVWLCTGSATVEVRWVGWNTMIQCLYSFLGLVWNDRFRDGIQGDKQRGGCWGAWLWDSDLYVHRLPHHPAQVRSSSRSPSLIFIHCFVSSYLIEGREVIQSTVIDAAFCIVASALLMTAGGFYIFHYYYSQDPWVYCFLILPGYWVNWYNKTL